MQIAIIIIATAMLIISFAAICKDHPAAGEMNGQNKTPVEL